MDFEVFNFGNKITLYNVRCILSYVMILIIYHSLKKILQIKV
jgi:hypothetical protein